MSPVDMRMHARRLLFFALAVGCMALLSSCAAVRQVRPLAKGESAVNVSLGGPMTNYVGDAFLPAPLLSLGYNYGVLPRMDMEVGLDLTHLLYGVAKVDLGVNWRPWQTLRWRPSLIVSPKLQLATDCQTSVMVNPDLILTAAWNPTPALYPYLGIENWFILDRTRPDGVTQEQHWLIAPFVGLSVYHHRWQYQAEFRILAPNLDNDLYRAPENVGFGDHGIIEIFLGIGRSFGPLHRRHQVAPDSLAPVLPSVGEGE
jgi:hypothetical protein